MLDWTKGCAGCLITLAGIVLALFALFWAASQMHQKPAQRGGGTVLPIHPRSPIPSEVEIEGRLFRPGAAQTTNPGEGFVEPGSKVVFSHDRVIRGEAITVVWTTAGPRHGAWKWGVLDADARCVVESYQIGETASVKAGGTIMVFLSGGDPEPYTMWFRIAR